MTADSVRLHITPLTPDLLHAVVGPRLLDSVSNVSYHTLQTFPENSYGYLDIPTMEAERIKKKLNGAILKGKKIKIEEARPKKRRRVEETEEEHPDTKAVKVSRKAKKEPDVIAGHALPSDRKVKRGWTEAKPSKSSKKDKGKTSSAASKYSDKDELLFRTQLPPNKTDVGLRDREKSKSKKRPGESVVHEFEKSTAQPSFLRQDVGQHSKVNLEYIEGQGWVDEDGHVVEQESERVARSRRAIKSAATTNRKGVEQVEVASGNESQHSDEDSPTKGEKGGEEEEEESQEHPVNQYDDETSSSGSSSESDSDIESEQSAVDTEKASSAIPESAEAKKAAEVHPLEALFKKPSKPTTSDVAKPSLEVSTSFSFFESGNEDDIEEETSMPGTPFSSQDNRSRSLRSAAPTPDTAHPSRFNSFGSSGLPGDEEMEADDEEATPTGQGGLRKQPNETPSRQQSDFEKKFWENRGENNRAWKLRRRTVLKEKRQRENKARRPRNW
ncbi:hypothetical protein EDD37DRAFT_634867 [Exophiala viscosa]|uniref:uncharacterized protein n=1 Tax=Exophiala viscosa TaxID=2486360 RepID=UPI002197573A|nr:hypothetical protein EDD37DRAFT_634867 [Exophiala viscosa]